MIRSVAISVLTEQLMPCSRSCASNNAAIEENWSGVACEMIGCFIDERYVRFRDCQDQPLHSVVVNL